MKKKNRFLLLFGSAIALTTVPLFTSCSSDDDATDPVKPVELPHTYNYGLWIYGEQGSQHVVLDSIASPITSIDGAPSWLTATIAPDTVRGGHPMIILECKDAKGSSLPDAKLTVTAENGDVANITVSHSEMTLGDAYDGSNASFRPCKSTEYRHHSRHLGLLGEVLTSLRRCATPTVPIRAGRWLSAI